MIGLKMSHKKDVVTGQELDDMHIDIYQKLLKVHFPTLKGLKVPVDS